MIPSDTQIKEAAASPDCTSLPKLWRKLPRMSWAAIVSANARLNLGLENATSRPKAAPVPGRPSPKSEISKKKPASGKGEA